MILLLLSALLASTQAAHNISLYGDVLKDVEFFTRTFPWIIDNIGGEIIVEYFMVGSGKYSVPQMCALEDLRQNTFLQAQYLKCEAKGNPSEYCLCEAGIDPKTFKQCVARGGSLASSASAKFLELGIDFTPIIELEPRSTIFGVEDIWFLKKICTIFGNNLPRGCVSYSNPYDSYSGKKPLAQIDRACHKEFPVSCDDDSSITLPPWSTTSPPTSTTTELPTTATPQWETTWTTEGTPAVWPPWAATTTTTKSPVTITVPTTVEPPTTTETSTTLETSTTVGTPTTVEIPTTITDSPLELPTTPFPVFTISPRKENDKNATIATDTDAVM